MASFRFGRPPRGAHLAPRGVTGRVGRRHIATADSAAGPSYDNHRFNPVSDRLEQGSVLEDWVPRDAPGINMMFRRIHARDVVAGPTVDYYSTIPWSEYDIGGVKDPSLRRFYEDTFQMWTPEKLSLVSKEYLIIGRFCASLMYDDAKGHWTEFAGHDPDLLEIQPIPMVGWDPKIDVHVSSSMRQFMASQDPRDQRARAMLPESFLDIFKKGGRVALPQFNTLFLARRMSINDHVGTSMLTRIVSIWAIEKALMDATVTAARRRVGNILHLTAGEEGWEASDEELAELVGLFTQAEEDPVGAVVATRNGVQANEVRQGGQLWKLSDEWAFLSEAKMRALGVSEAFLSGDATYNNMEAARSLFVEQILAFRDQLTRQIFEAPAVILAKAHNFTKKSEAEVRHRLNLRRDNEALSQRISRERASLIDAAAHAANGDEKAYEEFKKRLKRSQQMSMEKALRIPKDQLILPTIHWRKEMKPTQDQAYIELLEKMEEKGLPVPKRIWAAAGGYDLDAAIEMIPEDQKLSKRIDELNAAGEPQPAEEPVSKPSGGGGSKNRAREKLDLLKSDEPPADQSAPPASDKPASTEKPEPPKKSGPATDDPVKNPAPPSEVYPRGPAGKGGAGANPYASVYATFPFWTKDQFAGLKLRHAKSFADRLLEFEHDVTRNPKEMRALINSCFVNAKNKPIAAYLVARLGLAPGYTITKDDAYEIAREICASGQNPHIVTAELQRLGALADAGDNAGVESAKKINHLISRVKRDLATDPEAARLLLSGM